MTPWFTCGTLRATILAVWQDTRTGMYCIFKKSGPISYNKCTMKIGQDFLNYNVHKLFGVNIFTIRENQKFGKMHRKDKGELLRFIIFFVIYFIVKGM